MYYYKERQESNGFDCWGRMEWTTVYDFYCDDVFMFTVEYGAEEILRGLNKQKSR